MDRTVAARMLIISAAVIGLTQNVLSTDDLVRFVDSASAAFINAWPSKYNWVS